MQRRRLLWASLTAGLGIGLVFAFWPRATAVDLLEVTRGPLTVTLEEEGITRVRDVFVVSAPVGGRARRIEVEAGDAVVAGESVIAEIEPLDPELLDIRSETETQAAVRSAEAARSLAEAELERAQAEYDFARSELRRQQGLSDRGAASVRELDTAERENRTRRAARATARAALQAAIFELDRIRAHLVTGRDGQGARGECECIPIRAPVSGRVLRVFRESEGVVRAGDPLVEVGDPRALEIVADLLSAEAVAVEPGMRVWVEQWGGGQVLEARVRRVEPYGFTKVSALGIEEQRVNVIIDLESPAEQWRRLGHGYRVEVRIEVWQAESVLRLPLSALFRDGEDWAVFVVGGGRARLRPVERGRHTGLDAEIRSGLEVGERVVLYPGERIVEGARVRHR